MYFPAWLSCAFFEQHPTRMSILWRVYTGQAHPAATKPHFCFLQQKMHAFQQFLVLVAGFHNINARRLDAGVAQQVRQFREIFF